MIGPASSKRKRHEVWRLNLPLPHWRNRLKSLALWAYFAIDFSTFVYLTLFDGYVYTWWNWLIVVPLNAILSTMWPIYWVVLRPIFG